MLGASVASPNLQARSSLAAPLGSVGECGRELIDGATPDLRRPPSVYSTYPPNRVMHAADIASSVGTPLPPGHHTDHAWSASRLGARQSIMPWFATLSVSSLPTSHRTGAHRATLPFLLLATCAIASLSSSVLCAGVRSRDTAWKKRSLSSNGTRGPWIWTQATATATPAHIPCLDKTSASALCSGILLL